MITNQKKDFILIILGLFLLILSCTSVKAQIEGEPRKSVHIQQVLNPPTIDGLLDDEMWDQATIVSDLHQTDPIEYAEASEKSEFYVAYDKDALYVAARLYDSQ